MKKWMDELENAADKLQSLSRKVVKEAAEGFENVRPVLADKIDDAKEAYQKKARPFIEDRMDKAKDGLRTAYEKARPAIEEGMDKAALSAKSAYEKASEFLSRQVEDSSFEPVQEDEQELAQDEAIDQEVEDRLAQIRSASDTPNMISDFIRNKYGKK